MGRESGLLLKILLPCLFACMLFATSKASRRPGIINGLVARLHLGLNPRLNYFVIVVTDW